MRFLLLLLIPLFLIVLSCRQEENNTSQIISEVEQKETELKDIGVPKFLQEEQKMLETNTNQMSLPPDTDEFFGTKTKKTNVDKNIIVEEKVMPREVVTEEVKQEFIPKPVNVKTQKLSRKPGNDSKKPRMDLKLFFSYFSKNRKFVDFNNPGKITSVVYVGNKNIWYVDYSVYVIPYKNVSNYKVFLVKKNLIGIGRKISVVDGRSQLTVYWRGKNLDNKLLPNGKYSIVVKAQFRNSNNKIVSSYTKILGGRNPVIVVLAN
ncbi:MAG: hypothetical protein N2712_04670 [Brevinematales bacterium]|nr:hypothetical protein [Brevinematales bacterium]